MPGHFFILRSLGTRTPVLPSIQWKDAPAPVVHQVAARDPIACRLPALLSTLALDAASHYFLSELEPFSFLHAIFPCFSMNRSVINVLNFCIFDAKYQAPPPATISVQHGPTKTPITPLPLTQMTSPHVYLLDSCCFSR